MKFATGGSLFLDEIGELPLHLQAKLLRAVQERRIRQVGGTSEIEVALRIVPATSRDLEMEVQNNLFRSDLYFRINVVRIELPPLRDRAKEVALLAGHFLERYAREMGRDEVTLDPAVPELLSSYPWPRNVRELQNAIKRMLALSDGDFIGVKEIPVEIAGRMERLTVVSRLGCFDLRDKYLAAFEGRYLSRLLQSNGGDVTAAAAEADVPKAFTGRIPRVAEPA